MAGFDLGICTFVLNEEKFLRHAVESYLSAPCVGCVAIVEGAVKGGGFGADSQGLSTDGTAEIARELAKDDRVVFEQMGWVENKAQLQSRGFDIITRRLGNAAIFGLAGADELYHAKDLARVQAYFVADPTLKILSPTFHHFWWRPDLVAVGGNWNTKMHRFYRSPGQRMTFAHHAAPPADCAVGRQIKVDDVRCFHYVGMADKPKIVAKLDLYRRRDGHRLNVKDTWTNWKWGESTQWTHGGGTAKRFDGKHPPIIADDVWELTPRDAAGNKLPLPYVPWDEKKPFVKRRIGVFFDDKIPTSPLVRGLLRDLVKQGHKVTAYTLEDLPDAKEVRLDDVRDFDARSLRGNELIITFPHAFAFPPSGPRHVAILCESPKPGVSLGGYTVFQLPGVDEGYDELPLPDGFTEICLGDLPLREESEFGQPSTVSRGHSSSQSSSIQRTPGRYKRRGPMYGVAHTEINKWDGEEAVQITNTRDKPWTPHRHEVVARWWDGLGSAPIPNAPTFIRPLPKVIRPGERLEITVQVPDYRGIIDAGFLVFVVDIREDKRHMLNVGPRVKKFLK